MAPIKSWGHETFLIKALLFDIGGVVLPFSEWQEHDQKWEALLGLHPGDIERRIWKSEKSSLAVIGRVTFEEFMDWLGIELGLTESQLTEWNNDQNSLVRYDHEVENWLRNLKQTYKVAFISNAWSNGREENCRIGLDELADLMVISAEEGVSKPDPRIYEVTLNRLGVKASEALFVDDRPENVQAAIKLGIRGIISLESKQMMREVNDVLARSA